MTLAELRLFPNYLGMPKDKKELMRFLGMVKYLGKFIPKLSELTAPLRMLTRNDTIWCWSEEHTRIVNNLKNILTSSPILSYYDENKPLLIQSDACKDGLGCVLLQNGKPIAFASRSLTKTEQKYAMIEKEMLGICFAVEHFHYFTYGREILIQTDHKPLISIVQRKIEKVPNRLQRMMLKLTKYRYKLSYLPGSQMVLADALSRATVGPEPKDDDELKYVVHSIITNAMSDDRRKIFQEETKVDPILSKINKFLETNKWPQKLSADMKDFHQIRHELIREDGLILFGNRIIVPINLRKEILKLLHEGHLGVSKTRNKARAKFYWPNMSKEIETYINNCQVCLLNRPTNASQPMIPQEIPILPWYKLGLDILEFENQNYLVTMDYFTKWIELVRIKTKSVYDVKKACMVMFSTHGFPKEIISDNNPFGSHEFRSFLSEIGAKLTTSSPHYPKGHALAESGVKICKNILRKAKMSGQDPYLLLFHYRNTPVPSTKYSPSQLLFNRILRDKTTINEKELHPRIIQLKDVVEHLNQYQSVQ